MREIKFDAIYKPTGEHFIPNTLDFNENIVTGNFDGEINDWCHFSLDGKYGDVIVREYTGLKDKNGVGIFEGDIVQIKDHAFQGAMNIDGNYEVFYNEYMELCCGSLILFRQLPYVTVIGNRFENPELLEVK